MVPYGSTFSYRLKHKKLSPNNLALGRLIHLDDVTKFRHKPVSWLKSSTKI